MTAPKSPAELAEALYPDKDAYDVTSQHCRRAYVKGHAAGRESAVGLIEALEFIGQNAPSETMRNNWLVGSLIRVIEVDAERANEALARWKASAK